MPAEDGNPRGIRGGWGLGIPANLSQEQKDCAFHILTYITSADFEKHQVMNYQTDPNRSSTGADPEIAAELPYIPAAVAAIESRTDPGGRQHPRDVRDRGRGRP